MGRKQILFLKQAALFAAACAILLLYFQVDVYSRLFNGRLANIENDIEKQSAYLSLQARERSRFGDAYLFTQYVKYYLDSPKVNDPLILLPPAAYLKAYNVDAMVPEPIVYYYFTGYKCVTTESNDVYKANYAIFIKNNALAIARVRSRRDIDEVLELYKTTP